ncbi:MAG TPA: ferrochelatase [Pyrinomonadaceae bacterium]|nr:ferrochelatase [Pyrinomonadaceae bacterium]
MNRTGVLLINIGTPDDATPEAVGRYLREFLMDGYVLDMPYIKRWLLVNRIIVPRRKHYSAKHYQEIQTEEGSPLMFNTRRFAAQLSDELNRSGEYLVEIGMRYGNPSIRAALSKLKTSKVDQLVVMPLYPQYTQSSFETAVVEAKKRARQLGFTETILVPPFYADAGFVKASAQRIEEHIGERELDHVLFSYHGVPVRHIKQIDPSGSHCLGSPDCCAEIGTVNQSCYRAQCVATSRAIARELELEPGRYTTCFQSQFGKDEWIGPSLENLLAELPGRGAKRVAVSCPSFVADCLETLEEIGMRGVQEFKEAGGDELTLVPCLNSDPAWIKAAADLILQSQGIGRRAKAAGVNDGAPTG